MTEKAFRQLLLALLALGVIGWVALVVGGHPSNAVVSFDEGFHGGIALYVAKVLGAPFTHPSLSALSYIRGEFNNGIIFYPPLWNAVAGFLGWTFGPSTAVFRFATTLFSLATAGLVYGFVKTQANVRAAWLAVVVLLTMPIFVIYSHLMMLEIPLAFGVALGLLAFYHYLTTPSVSKRLMWWVSLAVAVGVQGKIIGIAVMAAVLGLYGLALFLFWRQSEQTRRFFNWPTALFAAVGAISWWGYIWAVKHFLHADMLGFFLGQSKGITGTHLNPLAAFVATAWQHKSFYLRDFAHYPIWSLVWFGSLFVYLIWKRTPLAAFLVCYVAGTWIIFSGVAPQTVQYILPLFIPLVIATGLVIVDLLALLPKPTTGQALLVGLAVLLAIGQLAATRASETQGWRYNVTDQEAMALYVAVHARTGDRVITWNDGTMYAVRLAGFDKKLQTYNGNTPQCANALTVSTDWAIVEPGPDQINHLALLSSATWQKAATYPTSGGSAFVFHNPLAAHVVPIEAETLAVNNYRVQNDTAASAGQAVLLTQSLDQPNIWGCYRLLPLGARSVTFRLKADSSLKTADPNAPLATLEVGRLGGATASQLVTASELSTGYQDFSVTLTNDKIDSMYEFKVWVNQNVGLRIDTITIR